MRNFPKLALFDLDGTLLDSAPDFVATIAVLRSRRGEPPMMPSALRPHVFVKGGDYQRDNIPEAPLVEQLGGAVHILPYLQDRSTTRIIERREGRRQCTALQFG